MVTIKHHHLIFKKYTFAEVVEGNFSLCLKLFCYLILMSILKFKKKGFIFEVLYVRACVQYSTVHTHRIGTEDTFKSR